jgi:hypothetical protein
MRSICWTGLFLSAVCLPLAAQTAPSSNVINVCVGNLTGVVREVANSKDCLRGLETYQQINITGPQGPQGPQGPMGAQGLQGLQGAQGLQGLPGSKGAAGVQGVAGPAGPMGATGAAGATGAIGPMGVPGTVGPQGPAGVAGPQGSAGAVGAVGAQGPIGETGPAGATGTIGSVTTYSASVAYTVGQVVYCQASGACNTAGQGSSYVSLINANTGNDPYATNGADWQQITAAGASGTGGSAVASVTVGTVSNTAAQGAGTLTINNSTTTPTVSVNFPTYTLPTALQAVSSGYSTGGRGTGGSFNGSSANGAAGAAVCTLGDTILSAQPYSGTYLLANGQLLTITSYEALFSLLGTRFGGDGQTNFALPNLTSLNPPGLYYAICVSGVFPSRN